MIDPGRREAGESLAALPRLRQDDPFPFVCVGCGSCCRERRDLLLSGYDLYRLARRLDLPPRLVADAFCRQGIGPQTLLPTLVLRPNSRTGDCPFFEANACTVHTARPLACALYPLGQEIDPGTGRMEYYLQTPVCGAQVPDEGRTLRRYLEDAGVQERSGIDARWAVVCTELSQLLAEAGGTRHPRFRPAVRRAARALYFDYSIRDDFYPQFTDNVKTLFALLRQLLSLPE